MPGRLILVCGLPGAGKTTLARKLADTRNAIRLSPDEWIEVLVADPTNSVERDRLRDPIENLQWDFAQDCLACGATVILDNGFWSEEERYLYAMGALELEAQIELHFLEAPLELLWQRVAARNAVLENKTFVMTRHELDEAWSLFQPPTEHELAFYDDNSVIRQR